MHQILSVTVLAIVIATHPGAGQARADSDTCKFCAGYPMPPGAQVGPAPRAASLDETDVNCDGAIDLIATYPGGGGALFINCGGGVYYPAIQSTTRLYVKPAKKGGWASIDWDREINWETERSILIDGKLYRPDILPFTSEAPTDFLIEHDGVSYTLPFGNCEALGIRAPRYRFDRKLHENGKSPEEEVTTLQLETVRAKFQIHADAQDAYSFGKVYSADLNTDGSLDAVLEFWENFGSGAEVIAGLLLGCGDGSFILSGIVPLGRVGRSYSRLQSRKISICGASFEALVYKRLIDVRPGEVKGPISKQSHKNNYELYLYQPTLKQFLHITAVLGPGKSNYRPVNEGQCVDILKPLPLSNTNFRK